MGNVVRLAIVPPTNADPYEVFCEARRSMLRSFAAWLSSGPALDLLQEEADGTRSALNHMRELLGTIHA